jgi:predicted DNA-binding transcriptional regulator AlpA
VKTNTAPPIKALHDEKREAERLGISVRTLQQWRRTGDGPPYVKMGSAVRYNPEAVDAWVADRTVNSTAQATV